MALRQLEHKNNPQEFKVNLTLKGKPISLDDLLYSVIKSCYTCGHCNNNNCKDCKRSNATIKFKNFIEGEQLALFTEIIEPNCPHKGNHLGIGKCGGKCKTTYILVTNYARYLCFSRTNNGLLFATYNLEAFGELNYWISSETINNIYPFLDSGIDIVKEMLQNKAK
jgi:hypothetical protein